MKLIALLIFSFFFYPAYSQLYVNNTDINKLDTLRFLILEVNPGNSLHHTGWFGLSYTIDLGDVENNKKMRNGQFKDSIGGKDIDFKTMNSLLHHVTNRGWALKHFNSVAVPAYPDPKIVNFNHYLLFEREPSNKPFK